MTELSDILPKDLKELFNSLDYEEQGNLTINSIKYLENELYFDFTLFMGDKEQNETQSWQLQVQKYLDSKIDIYNLGSYFNFYTDHYLLWEFTDHETELYFKLGTDNPEKLLADIYSIHNTVFEKHFSLEKFINGDSLLTLCKSDKGLFARGPKRILKFYFDALAKAGNEPYFFEDIVVKRLNENKSIPENSDLKVALLGGTFFIGQNFTFKRLNI